MKSVTQYHTDMEIQRRGFGILLKEMGLAETLRFHVSCERGTGDYTKERPQHFKGSAVDELYGEILSRRKKKRISA